HPALADLSPLSLHDALPISDQRCHGCNLEAEPNGHPFLGAEGHPVHGMTPCGSPAVALPFKGRTLRKSVSRWRTDFLSSILRRRSEEHTSELQSLTNIVCRL